VDGNDDQVNGGIPFEVVGPDIARLVCLDWREEYVILESMQPPG